jgi:hypothetical protein
MKDSFFSGEAKLQDKNLDFKLDADLDYTSDIPNYKVVLSLNMIDLQALHLSQRNLQAKATLEATLSTTDFKKMNGNIGIRNVAIYNGEKLYKVDSLIFISLDEEGKSELSIQSDILEGKFSGTFNLMEMPKTLKQHIQRYFMLQDSTIKEFNNPQRFNFDLTIKNTEMLTKILIPDLQSLTPGKISGEFDSEKALLKLHVDISKTQSRSFGIEEFSVDVNSDPKTLYYKIILNDARLDTLLINEIRWNGELANNLLETDLIIFDSLQKEKYVFAANVQSLSKGFKIHLLPDQLMLNYKNWSIPNDNSIVLADNYLAANNFTLTNNQQQLGIVSNPDELETAKGAGPGFTITIEKDGARLDRTYVLVDARVYQVDEKPAGPPPPPIRLVKPADSQQAEPGLLERLAGWWSD